MERARGGSYKPFSGRSPASQIAAPQKQGSSAVVTPSSSATSPSSRKTTTTVAKATRARSSVSRSQHHVPPQASKKIIQEPQPDNEFSVRVVKNNLKPISIMRFNGALGVVPDTWTGLEMAREGTSKSHKTGEEANVPRFGAGSEYGREAREEAKRKRYKKKYNADKQPWKMTINSETSSKKYRGAKEGGVAENASYYLFTRTANGAFEVSPVKHWYNCTPIQTYTTLTAEEAEEQFERRNKIYNYVSVMVQKRLKADEEDNGVEGGEGLPPVVGQAAKKSLSGLKVSEMEDWEGSSESDSSDEAGSEKKKKKKGDGKPQKKQGGKVKEEEEDEEPEEDSDDGDREGREVGYISDSSSESETEEGKEHKNAEAGVDQEVGLEKLLDSDSEDEEKKIQVKRDVLIEDEQVVEQGGQAGKGNFEGKWTETTTATKRKLLNNIMAKVAADNNCTWGRGAISLPNLSAKGDKRDGNKGTDVVDNVIETSKFEFGSSSGGGNNSSSSSLQVVGTPGEVDPVGTAPALASGTKRNASGGPISGLGNALKKARLEISPELVQSAASEGFTEDAVRRCLGRKRMTASELAQTLNSRTMQKMSREEKAKVIVHILKKIKAIKSAENGKMYFSLPNKT